MQIQSTLRYVPILSNQLRTTVHFRCILSPKVEASGAAGGRCDCCRSVDLVDDVTGAGGRTGDAPRVIAWAHFVLASKLFLPNAH